MQAADMASISRPVILIIDWGKGPSPPSASVLLKLLKAVGTLGTLGASSRLGGSLSLAAGAGSIRNDMAS